MAIRKHPLYGFAVWVILLIGLGFLLFITMRSVTDAQWLSIDDYVEYWAAGRLNMTGGNPYNPDEILPLKHQAGRYSEIPLMMWNPPWMLAIAMPFSALDYALGRTIWLLLSIAIIITCADITWSFYGGPTKLRWLSWLIGLTFIPVLDCLRVGQTAVFMLLGIVGFLYFLRRRNNWLAGACLTLLAIKPHILFVFAIAVLFWCIKFRRWSIILSAFIVLGTATLLAWLVNPSVFQQYIYATTHYPPEEWATPTMGSVLRIIFGIEHFWLQFVPTMFGIVWIIYYWTKHHTAWDWHVQAPLLTLVSVCTSAYGWTYDQPVFILPIVSIFASIFSKPLNGAAWVIIISYASINALDYMLRIPQIWLWWLAPLLLVWYLVSNRFSVQPIVTAKNASGEPSS